MRHTNETSQWMADIDGHPVRLDTLVQLKVEQQYKFEDHDYALIGYGRIGGLYDDGFPIYDVRVTLHPGTAEECMAYRDHMLIHMRAGVLARPDVPSTTRPEPDIARAALAHTEGL